MLNYFLETREKNAYHLAHIPHVNYVLMLYSSTNPSEGFQVIYNLVFFYFQVP